jgi:ribA/ribD-fused uncharacterized protein
MTKIKFYKTLTQEKYGAFSNFSQHAIFVDGKIWKTSEHYFQAMKFKPTFIDLIEKIRVAKTPANAAALGRDPAVAPYMREQWDEKYRVLFMKEALYAKFTQHPDLRELREMELC